MVNLKVEKFGDKKKKEKKEKRVWRARDHLVMSGLVEGKGVKEDEGKKEWRVPVRATKPQQGGSRGSCHYKKLL